MNDVNGRAATSGVEMAQSDNAAQRYQGERIAHWNGVGQKFEGNSPGGKFYQNQLVHYYKLLVPPGLRLLEIGCGHGDLLAALQPSVGVGVDFSVAMLKQASERHPRLRFIQCDAHEFSLNETFDIIILSDLINDLWDVQIVFERLARMAGPQTRVILNTYNRIWQIPLGVAQRLGLSKPTLEQNWLTVDDIANLLQLTGFEVIKHTEEILVPFYVPLLSKISNRVLVRFSPFSWLGLSNFIVARLTALLGQRRGVDAPLVSVVVPARNEAGNIEGVFTRTPEMGCGTELVFVEGHSWDNTYDVIEQAMARHPERKCRLLTQMGRGKGDAVRCGFDNASGEILMILDADLTVPPENLTRFYEALVSGRGEFINGVRLVYPMEGRAMRVLNMVGNKFFSLAFSWLLGQPIKDTLCGTKVLWKRDYELIASNRAYFGDFDPFGDFDLLFGASKANLRMVDLPIRYRDRTYGDTNIQRWQHGWLLLKMVAFAAGRIKFV